LNILPSEHNILPKDEEKRLTALRRYEILDTSVEESFNNIAKIMTHVFKTPIALVSLVDEDKVFFKGNIGMPGVKYTDRSVSLCSFAILSPAPTIFSDPKNEPCLLANPLVHGDFGLRFYAGAPLITLDGHNIGSVCIVDKEQRIFTALEEELLVRFSKMVMNELEFRLAVAKQEKIEGQLEAANKELRFVTDTMPQLVWATDGDGNAYFFNERWNGYTGLHLDELAGRGWLRTLHPNDIEKTIRAWALAVETGVGYELEYRVKRHDGAYRWFLARGTAMKNESGKIIKWYGTTTDVHDQKKAEEDIIETNERFDLVAKATQDCIWDWDLKTNLIWWNEGFKELFGYKDEDIEPTIDSWYKRVHPDDKERVVENIHQVIKGGKNWSEEYRFLKKDKSYATVFDRGYALHNEEGVAIRMLGSMQDITSRKVAEDALKESEARTRLAVASAAMGTFEIDVDKQTIIHSRRAAEIFGLDPDKSWSYKNFLDAVIEEDQAIREKAHAIARETGSLLYEARLKLPDRTIRWIRLNGTLISQQGNNYLIGTALDITEEKEAASLLERKIEERTTELKIANEQLKQFSYAASHDLQEPLRKIHFFTERLMNGLGTEISEINQRYAGKISQAVSRMSNLINDLLDYSNSTLGNTSAIDVDLNKVVEEVMEDMEATIIETNAVIKKEDLPVIKGDPRQMKQLFQNLISNGIKYHKKEIAPLIQLSSRKIIGARYADRIPANSTDKFFHQIEVSDNGIGIAEEHLHQIFGIFKRLHGKAEYEGTGLGLAIVQKVVDNHQGQVWVESTVGVGATFNVVFPA
jgi:PAS domain S-box-containing protein